MRGMFVGNERVKSESIIKNENSMKKADPGAASTEPSESCARVGHFFRDLLSYRHCKMR